MARSTQSIWRVAGAGSRHSDSVQCSRRGRAGALEGAAGRLVGFVVTLATVITIMASSPAGQGFWSTKARTGTKDTKHEIAKWWRLVLAIK